MKQLKNIALLCAVLILTGYASRQKEFIALPETVQAQLESTDVYLVDCPEQMGFDIKSSNVASYTGGGLIFGLIDAAIMSSRQSDAEEAIGCIQGELKNIKVQNILHDKLIPLYKNNDWLKTRHVHHVTDFSKEKCKALCNSSKSDGTLVSVFYYKLSPDFKTLTGTLHVTLYPTGENLMRLVKTTEPVETPIFKTNVSATEILENSKDDIKENAKLWAQDNGSYLKSSMESLARKLVLSLENVMKHPNYSLEG